MLLWPFNKYPGTDYETYNWEWILKTVKDWNAKLTVFQNDFMDAIKNSNLTKLLTDILVSHPELLTFGLLPYVTPEMYGAAGDGETDDTQALVEAIATGKTVILWQKYLITDTVTVGNGDLRGANNGEIIYEGNNTALKFETPYRSPGKCKNFKLTGPRTNLETVGIEIDRGSWGGCVLAQNIDISGFTHPFTMDNCFNVNMVDVRTVSDGDIIITGDNPNTAFSNNIRFQNAYFSGSTQAEKLIRMVNTINVLFESCTFEHADIAVDMTASKYVSFINGWEEDVESLYVMDGSSWEPLIEMVSIIRSGITNKTDMDRWEPAAYTKYFKQKSSSTDRLFNIRSNDEFIINRQLMANESTGTYTRMYDATTKHFNYLVPNNSEMHIYENVDTFTIDLLASVYNTGVASKHDLTVYAVFPDSSYKTWKLEVLSTRGTNNIILPNTNLEQHQSSWGTANTTTLTLTRTSVGITATLSETPTRIDVWHEYKVAPDQMRAIP